MHVRRSLYAWLLVTSLTPIASVAFAQDTAIDGGAPIATSATASVTTPPPPPTVTATVVVPPPTTTTSAISEQEPLRLGRFLQVEADRARAARYGNAAFGTIGGAVNVGIGIAVYAVVSSDSSLAGSDQSLFDFIAAIPIVFGGLSMLSSILSLFSVSPMENLVNAYAPIAVDKSLTPAQRLGRGEGMLVAAAGAEHGRRVVSSVTSFVFAGLMAGVAVFFAADTSLFPGTPDGALFAASFAGLSVAEVITGIGQLTWERGPAEVVWEQWHAAHEDVVVQVSQVHFAPLFAPTHGGATAGFSLRF
jgi:hypothetical protein